MPQRSPNPENNCLATIRATAGFPLMPEKSGIPAYIPFEAQKCRLPTIHRYPAQSEVG